MRGKKRPAGRLLRTLRHMQAGNEESASLDSFQIILAASEEDYRIYSLEELLPVSFGPENL